MSASSTSKKTTNEGNSGVVAHFPDADPVDEMHLRNPVPAHSSVGGSSVVAGRCTCVLFASSAG